MLSDSEQPITLARLLIENALPGYAGENSVSRKDVFRKLLFKTSQRCWDSKEEWEKETSEYTNILILDNRAKEAII